MVYNPGIEIALIITAPSIDHIGLKIVLSDNKLPKLKLESKSSLVTLAEQLLSKHTKLALMWVNLEQCYPIDSINYDDTLVIPFICMIPEATTVYESEWKDLISVFNECDKYNEKDLEIIKYCLSKI